MLHCNAGKAIVTQKGGPQRMWNHLVLSRGHRKYSVPTQGSREVQGHIRQFYMHKSDGTNRMLKPSIKWLFISDSKHEMHILVYTVDSIKK